MTDELMFQDDAEISSQAKLTSARGTLPLPPWILLVVDDEESVHQVTRLALRDLVYDGRSLSILSAHSAAQARKILEDTPGIAVILLDVVMETDHAGLELARYIRQDLNNHDCRIVLRTGQPGQAPEMDIISTYDINDYKDKTELTAQKLYTLMLACLRSYRDIEVLHNSRSGLQNVIQAARAILQKQTVELFLEAAQEHLCGLLNLDPSIVYLFEVSAFQYQDNRFVRVGTASPDVSAATPIGPGDPVSLLLNRSQAQKESCFEDYSVVVYCRGYSRNFLFYLHSPRLLTSLDRSLLSLLSENLNIALENIDLNEKARESQQDMIYRMGELVETHSPNAGSHVRRVALYSELLARLAGLQDVDVDMIRRSSPLHDLGKIGIPDKVLNKPGKLDSEEWTLMKSHAELGYQMLSGSGSALLEAGAIISLSHHEHWDGSGYPKGLKGEDIPILGRITALADVFDALGTNRCYKGEWEVEAIVSYIEARSGLDFDPRLVELFRQNLDLFLEIREATLTEAPPVAV